VVYFVFHFIHYYWLLKRNGLFLVHLHPKIVLNPLASLWGYIFIIYSSFQFFVSHLSIIFGNCILWVPVNAFS
jgi:hypothetical protein